MPKFKQFSFQELSKEHLSVLRALGRAVGVKAPAAKGKKELIEDIISVSRGLIEPATKTNKGAPPKIDMDLSRFYEKDEFVDNGYNLSVDYSTIRLEDGDLVGDEIVVTGTIDESLSGYAFVRVIDHQITKDDVYVSPQNVKKYNLRAGDRVKCIAKPVRDGNAPALQSVISMNELDPDVFKDRKCFDDLLPYFPVERLSLEREDGSLAERCIDLFAPIGKGQRGLIVAPPKTGKTTLLKRIAKSIETNNPEVKLIVLLIDERPEEVTDIKLSIQSEVISSTFDQTADHHVRTAESVICRAKRMVEAGVDVVILLDSITRLARAYNNTVESSGKILSGGLDPVAVQSPKRFFGSARNFEGEGSLTILATALVETGSRLDEVIYEEFKGTGNMEIHLSRSLAEKRVFPAFDLYKSGTRKEELLLSDKELKASYKLRKLLSSTENATEKVLDLMEKTSSNNALLSKLDEVVKTNK